MGFVETQRLLRPLLTLPALLICTLAFAQAPTFSTDVRVVSVFATVRDAQGRIRHDLGQNDFVLEEGGRPQMVQYFDRQTNQPLTLGLLIDTSASMLRVLGVERDASKKFFQQVLREDKDKAFLVHFDRSVELWQDLTSSHKRLESMLGQLDPQTWYQRQMSQSRVDPSQRRGASTTLYDAIATSANAVLKKQPGRKAIVLLSDGVDAGSRATLETAVEAAQRADTLVYSIHIYVEDPEGPLIASMKERRQREIARGSDVLKKLSRDTGGGYFDVSKEHPITQIYAEIEDELRNQYSLGYAPGAENNTPGFHAIQLTTKNSDLSVQARTGYYVER